MMYVFESDYFFIKEQHMKDMSRITQLLNQISHTQFFGVLATSKDNNPYTTLVAFLLDDDLKTLYFVTPRDTRKFGHLSSNGAVSLLIHNSSNKPEDTSEAVGVTISGKAAELSKPSAAIPLKMFLDKHPQLKEFTTLENTAFIAVKISRYDIVERFQNVTVLKIDNQEEKL